MSNQTPKPSAWADLKYGFKTYFGKPPLMHRGVYWARMITFFFIGMVTYVVAKNLIACECHCESTLSMNATLEDSGLTLELNSADASMYFYERMVEASSSSSSISEGIS